MYHIFHKSFKSSQAYMPCGFITILWTNDRSEPARGLMES